MLLAIAATWMARCVTGSTLGYRWENWPATGGFGPWLVTADEIRDPQNLNITTRLNGQTVQQDNTSSMVYTIAELIAYISMFSVLSPGDVILTGTPGGIGKNAHHHFLCMPEIVLK